MDPYGLDWHHLVPFTGGLNAGLSPDFINGTGNGLDMSQSDHRALHKAGWLKDWNKFFKDLKGKCTEKQANAQLRKMMNDPKYKNLLKGTPATKKYPGASGRLKGWKTMKGIGTAVGIAAASASGAEAANNYMDAVGSGDSLGMMDAANDLSRMAPAAAQSVFFHKLVEAAEKAGCK